jgi:hypothetical protein
MHKSKKSSYQFYWTLGWTLVFLSSSNFLGLLGWKLFLDFRLEAYLGLLGRKLIFLSSSINYHLYA